MHPPTFLGPLTRWAAAAAVMLLAIVAWRGVEVHDEVVNRPVPRTLLRSVVPSDTATAIEYVEGYEAGLRRAAVENRPMLVIFRAGWCRWSAELTQGPLADRRLIALSRQFVCVVVDADRHAAECRRCGVKEFPTVVLAAPSGEERQRWVGCPGVEELLAALSDGRHPSRMAAGDAGDAGTTR